MFRQRKPELQPGEDYNELKPAYVIYLCCFDLYGQGKPVYNFLRYEFVTAGDTFIENLDADIDGLNSGERVVQIMTLEQEILIRENKVRKEAFAEGKSIGMAAANKQTASALAAKGMPIEEIAEIIGLSVSEVKTLLDS